MSDGKLIVEIVGGPHDGATFPVGVAGVDNVGLALGADLARFAGVPLEVLADGTARLKWDDVLELERRVVDAAATVAELEATITRIIEQRRRP